MAGALEGRAGEGKKRGPVSRRPHVAAILFEVDRLLFDPDDNQVLVRTGLTIQKRKDRHSRVVNSYFINTSVASLQSQ
jgi:hypothetical protein